MKYTGKIAILSKYLLPVIFLAIPFSINAQLYYQWAHQGGSNGLDQGYDIAVDNSGNVYTTGVYEGHSVFTPNPGAGDTLYHTAMSDAFISKYDANGDYQWAIRIIGDTSQPGNQNQIPYGIATDANGDVYITGRIDSKSDFDPSDAPGDTAYLYPDAGRAYIAKYNPSGQLIWAKNFGGNTQVQGSALKIGASGNIYLHGYFNGTADFDPAGGGQPITTNGGYDFFVAQYDPQGNLNWANGFGSTGSDFAGDIAINSNEDIFICGRFEGTVDFDPGIGTTNLTSAGSSDPFIARYQSNGNLTWAISIAGTGTEYIWKIALDSNNNTAVTGYITGSADFDPSAATHILTSNGGQDAFVAHYDGNGNLNWAFNPGNASNDNGNGVAFNSAGDVFFVGNFTGTMDFDPSPATAAFSVSNTEVFIAQYDFLGGFIWAGVFGGPALDFANSAVTDASGNLYLTGGFQGPNADMDPDTAAQNTLQGFGSWDVFTLKLNTTNCPPVDTSFTTDICSGDSVFFGGEYLSQAGIYSDTLLTTDGCDSIVNMNLNINNSTTSTITATACERYTSPSGSETYNLSGTYFDTVPNTAGCDSMITINLTINNSTTSTITATACANYTSPSGNDIYTITGTYTDTLANAADCDSVITINLIIHQHTIGNITITEESSYSSPSGHHTWTESGTYTDTIPNEAGCDSLLTIDLTIISEKGHVEVPSAFSPNNDGRNDVLISIIHNVSSIEFRIYNRWGEEVFYTSSLNEGWNGQHKNKDQPIGTFTYVLTATTTDGTPVRKTGTVTLIR